MTPPPSGPYDPSGPSGRWSDLERPPLNPAALRRALITEDSLWTRLEVAEVTGSTNADLRERARRGHAAAGAVLAAEEQTQGRGRLGRTWNAPARSGLFCSVLLTPGPAVPEDRWGWLPLLAGVAAASGLSRVAGVEVALKWPNDLLVTVGGTERKLGGILAERTALADGTAAVVLGMGINVSLRADELPVAQAGSLLLAGAPVTDRDPLLRAVLRALADWYERWTAEGGDPAASGLLEAYASGCSTLGRRVRALLPGGDELRGEAVALDGDGRLVIASAQGVQQPVAAADIVHLRPDAG
ncbi:biotin--[acetyl-CoA-carboxylase] ligase [Streptomyces sp. YIM 98790]|uniref:biotin--[acetyl-CoA-carboxylase] ligase n=1 Tax=Streptomyces sp. YIM 98790 TaxID=2689077 RepID=UPI00140C2325|nr:biotin--[acetyl-CoA-carboxylase] ligase [Streptomyces sp. YIM 98790]